MLGGLGRRSAPPQLSAVMGAPQMGTLQAHWRDFLLRGPVPALGGIPITGVALQAGTAASLFPRSCLYDVGDRIVRLPHLPWEAARRGRAVSASAGQLVSMAGGPPEHRVRRILRTGVELCTAPWAAGRTAGRKRTRRSDSAAGAGVRHNLEARAGASGSGAGASLSDVPSVLS